MKQKGADATGSSSIMNKDIKYVGNYRILDIIGKGGMAKVFTAIQVPLDRVVVVKEMSKSSGSEYRKRFKNEALITATLEHPNIVSVYDYFSIGQTSYIVMQYVDGLGLSELIESEAPLHPVVAAVICHEMCLAIEYAHKNNVIHRDIKPTNILITKDGKLKVTDFGVAKDETARDLTSVGTLIGTPCYMSPEQAMGKKLTPQTDIFSLGIVLYELVTGKKPFWGETAEEITSKIQRGKYRSPILLDPHHSMGLSRIVNRSMKKNLNRRYETVTQMIHDLERFAGWKNIARSHSIMAQLVSRVEFRKQTTTVIKKKKTTNKKTKKKQKKRRGKSSLFFLYFLLIFVVGTFVYVLFRMLFTK
ncbi:MAG: serine/threonine protein kinase [candidate division WOR-3 bacterium]|nr:MAG: serine/threonine protein kinase [candidate division WOR-3 bacterium]